MRNLSSLHQQIRAVRSTAANGDYFADPRCEFAWPPVADRVSRNGVCADSLYAKGYLVASHYPGVFTDGTNASTTTAGLNATITDAYASNLMLYTPHCATMSRRRSSAPASS